MSRWLYTRRGLHHQLDIIHISFFVVTLHFVDFSYAHLMIQIIFLMLKTPMTKTPNTKEESPINARTFKDFDLNKYLLTALEKKGYDTPTEIQLKTLDAFSNGKHIAGQSQTGTGKTAAFLLPVLNALDTQKRAPQVLILAPTRELAHQIRDEVFELSKYMYMKSVCCYGGQSKRWQIEQLEKGPQVIIGTVGRVKDLIDMKKIRLSDINYFILDEVDRMLDM